MNRVKRVTLLFWAGLFISTAVLAQGTLIPMPHPPEIIPVPRTVFSIESQVIDVDIHGQVARTTIEQTFANKSRRDQEGMYLFPIPESASISKFTMWMNGEEVEGEVMEAARARRIYEDIVRRSRDPGLLEYVGRDLFRARVFPIPAGGDVRIKITYEEVLPYDAGLVTYRHPLKADGNRVGTIGTVSLAVNIESDVPIKSLYSPTHEIDTRRRGKRASCGFEMDNSAPDRDFLLYYAVSDNDVGLNLLTNRIADDDGYFMLLISPGDLGDDRKVIAKDVVFVLDKSGSMKGEKIEQAKAALKYCVESLNGGDRFNVIAFSTNVDGFSDRLVDASKKNRKNAMEFVDGVSARGGTDINEALSTALELSRSDRPQMVIFLTDGLPTVGETDIETILRNAGKNNRTRARVFPFGVGYDVNTALLDRLSIDHRGTVEYIRPEEDIEVKVSRFYDKVSSPVLSDITLDTGKIKTADVFPRDLPDVFNGTQLVILGRYDRHGPTTIELSGRVDDKTERLVYEGTFAKRTRANAFIPRLWANRKIAYLLSEIKLRGADRELVDEVIELSLEHGIITPYTSYLILEEGTESDRRRLSQNAPNRAFSPGTIGHGGSPDIGAMKFLSTSPSSRTVSGMDATEMSRDIAEDKIGSVLRRDDLDLVKYAGEKRFVLKDGEWIDAEFREGMDVEEIEFLGDEYFRLLDDIPEVREFLALGEKVTFVFNNQAYRITQ